MASAQALEELQRVIGKLDPVVQTQQQRLKGTDDRLAVLNSYCQHLAHDHAYLMQQNQELLKLWKQTVEAGGEAKALEAKDGGSTTADHEDGSKTGDSALGAVTKEASGNLGLVANAC